MPFTSYVKCTMTEKRLNETEAMEKSIQVYPFQL